jgi:hypothetical protein
MWKLPLWEILQVKGLRWTLGVQGNIVGERHVSPYLTVVVRGILDF